MAHASPSGARGERDAHAVLIHGGEGTPGFSAGADLRDTLERLFGFVAPAALWEEAILPARGPFAPAELDLLLARQGAAAGRRSGPSGIVSWRLDRLCATEGYP